jgi:hypothetical protein
MASEAVPRARKLRRKLAQWSEFLAYQSEGFEVSVMLEMRHWMLTTW